MHTSPSPAYSGFLVAEAGMTAAGSDVTYLWLTTPHSMARRQAVSRRALV